MVYKAQHSLAKDFFPENEAKKSPPQESGLSVDNLWLGVNNAGVLLK